ncbi:hypothetical protein I7830_05285 [Mammaliicoccus sciuri]|uniref:condensation domain-containing protein n=1 Tax=Mammaliicoccus sciuri TaxID=1296 RepID=UPI0018DDA75A|nr:hypothetical protein I7830_05285 [Mammaliicoccus sciuri]
MNIITKELSALYENSELPPIQVQYKDFANWQNESLKKDTIKKQESYWLNLYNDGGPVLNFPTDFPRPKEYSVEGDTVHFEIKDDLLEKLRALAEDQQVTMYMLIMACYTTLLSKYTNQEDIVIGSPIAGRVHDDLKSVVGMFVNTLALRNWYVNKNLDRIHKFIRGWRLIIKSCMYSFIVIPVYIHF